MTKNHIKNNTSQSHGFTIVETLVAITILMIAIVGPLTIANRGLYGAALARDQVIASYLAQDAMEAIKAMRTTYILESEEGDPDFYNYAGLSDCDGDNNSGQICYVETIGQLTMYDISPCDDFNDCRLREGSDGYTHVQTAGDKVSKFSRWFSVYDHESGSGQLRVRVEVSWYTGTIPNSTVYESFLFDYELL